MADEVKIGDTVFIKIDDSRYEYTILCSDVFDINKKEISSESPIGKGLMGHKKNDIVEIAIPEGKKIKCKILNIKD
jgi:transcription elongation factor GreA